MHARTINCVSTPWLVEPDRSTEEYLVGVDDSPEEGFAGVAAHPPVVEVRNCRVATHRAGDPRLAYKLTSYKVPVRRKEGLKEKNFMFA